MRMGQAKPNLLLKGRRLIDIILEVFKPLFEEIFIVTDDRRRFTEFTESKVVEDLVKGYGPLAGIYTGLKAISNEQAFFVACDMPFLRKDLIKRLLNTSLEEDCDVVVPYTSRGIEPLHAVYSKKNLRILADLLKGQDFSITCLLNRCKCKYIAVNKEEESSFFNLNTPEDLEKISSHG